MSEEEIVRAIVRQMCLAAVMVTALVQDINGSLVTVYFIAALAMAGVDIDGALEAMKS